MIALESKNLLIVEANETDINKIMEIEYDKANRDYT